MNGHIDEAWVSNNDDKYVQDKTLSGDRVHLSGLVVIVSLKSPTTIWVLVSDNYETGG